jgi:hypothetical protein
VRPAKATAVSFEEQHFTLSLADGRRLSVPLSWYSKLVAASSNVRESYEFFTVAEIQFVCWRALDVTLSVDGLLTTQGPITPWDWGDDENPKDETH